MKEKNEVHSRKYRCSNNHLKRKKAVINKQHIFCAFLITVGFFALLILTAGGQVFANFEEIQNGIEVQPDPARMEEETLICITPQMFGAAGDGEKDDTEAFLRLNDYCNNHSGTHIDIPAGHYIVNHQLTFTEDVSISGYGKETVLDFSGILAGSGAALEFTGSYRELGKLTNDLTAGRSTQPISGNYDLCRGDIVAILDQNNYSWNNGRCYYRKGEFCEVFSIASEYVDFTQNLYDRYDSGCQLFLMDMVRCSVERLQICVRDTGDVLGLVPLRLNCARDSWVRDVSLRGSNYAQLDVRFCYSVLLDHISAEFICAQNLGLNYGVIVENSQFVRVTNSILTALRHGMAIGGDAKGPCIVNRFITIIDSTINSSECTAADVHGNSQYIRYDRCTILNGFDAGGCDVTFSNCDIYIGKYSVWASVKPMNTGDFNLIGNHFYAQEDNKNVESYLFTLVLRRDEPRTKKGMIQICGNVFDAAGKNALLIDGSADENNCTVLLKDNIFRTGSICLKNIRNTVVENNYIQAVCQFLGISTALADSMDSIIITDNIFSDIDGNGIMVEQCGARPVLVKIGRNVFSKVRNTAVLIKETDQMQLSVNGNTYFNCGKNNEIIKVSQ